MPIPRIAQKGVMIFPPERVHASHAPGIKIMKKMRVWIAYDFSMVSP